MSLSPDEVRKKEFSSSLRGFEPQEVREFLSSLAAQMEELIREKEVLKHKVSELEERTTEFRQMEDVLKGTLSDAHDTAEQLRANAREDADRIRKQAELKAEEIIKQAQAEKEEIKSKIQSLQGQRLAFLEEMEEMLANYSRILQRLKEESAQDEITD